MTLKELSKTTQFVKNFKQEYHFLKIGEEMRYDLDSYNVGCYSITIHTGVRVVDRKHMNEFSDFLNSNYFSWFIGIGLDEIKFHVQ